MNKRKLFWLVVLLMVAFSIPVARAAFDSRVYMPIILVGMTATPTPTHTPLPTATEVTSVRIIEIYGNPDKDSVDEYVVIENIASQPIVMTGWRLKSETSGDVFIFERFTLQGKSTVKVWTKPGRNSSEELFWGRVEPVWKADKDCAVLRDQEKRSIHYYCDK